ncbi:MAG: peroxiredoxin [Ignavibacteriae bacterium]|nr:peroxiredoxin [Ignavibacteriota bacterium]
MKNLFIVALLFLIITGCNQSDKKESTTQGTKTPVSSDSIRDGIFIHITESYKDPHRILMPLKMAEMMSKDKDVLIYMDIHAVEVLVKTAKDIELADFESAHTYIKRLIQNKVTIMACPTCLKIAEFKPEDLMDGVQVAQKDKFFSFTKGRIITLDY